MKNKVMITEDYVSFEVTQLLKEKGFNEACEHQYYIIDKKLGTYNTTDRSRNPERYIDAPTHQMVMKWLREKDIIIVPQPEYFNVESKCLAWGVDIWANDNYEKVQADFPSYEEAVEAALKYCLKNLI